MAQPEIANTVDSQPVEDSPSTRYTWRIENFSRLNTKKLYSDVFSAGGFKWYDACLFTNLVDDILVSDYPTLYVLIFSCHFKT